MRDEFEVASGQDGGSVPCCRHYAEGGRGGGKGEKQLPLLTSTLACYAGRLIDRKLKLNFYLPVFLLSDIILPQEKLASKILVTSNLGVV